MASAAAIEDMRAAPAAAVNVLFNELDLGPEFDAFAERAMRRFDFASVIERLPTESFSGAHELRVGDRGVHLIELGPAHTLGDTIAHVPDAGVVFTGDLLFIEGTPIMWDGPVANWLTACDRIIELGARVIVPGHGPVTDESGVRDVQRYLTYVRDEARQRFDAGMDETAAADDIDLDRLPRLGRPRADRGQRRDDLSRARPLPAGAHASRAVRADGPVERAPLVDRAMPLIARRLLGLDLSGS